MVQMYTNYIHCIHADMYTSNNYDPDSFDLKSIGISPLSFADTSNTLL